MLNSVLMAAWLEPVLMAVGVGLAGLIALLFAKLNSWLSAKIKDVKIQNALLAVSEVVQNSVLAVQQTFVDQLKKDGKFDKEAQAKALQEALRLSMSNISAELREQVEVLYPDFEQWIKTMIESVIYQYIPHKKLKREN